MDIIIVYKKYKEDFNMIFPDGRNDNYYNEDFLDKPNKNFLDGFDWATEMAVDNFLWKNLEIYG